MENRTTNHALMGEILARWSPRAFNPDKAVSDADLNAILEAARFAPPASTSSPGGFWWQRTPAIRKKTAGRFIGKTIKNGHQKRLS